MKWLDAPLSAVMVKLTLLVVEEAIEEYPMPRGIVACRVVAGVSVDVVCSLCQTIWTRGLPTRDSSSITGLVLDKSFP